MLEDPRFNLDDLWSELAQVAIILQRPVVQFQLIGIGLSILLSWALSRWTWGKLTGRLPMLSQCETGKQRLSWKQYWVVCVRHLLTPTLSWILIRILGMGFIHWGWFAGYFDDGIQLFTYFWFYRLFIVCLYLLFPVQAVNSYRYRFFDPLFTLIAIGITLSWFLDLHLLSNVVFINFFDDAITLGGVFVAIAGLYFWIVGVSLLEILILQLFSRKTIQDQRLTQVAALLLRYFLIGLGIVLIFGYIGVSRTTFAAITGGLSVGIGFGLKEVIGNFVSGIWLLFEGALKPGDIVKINDKISKVTKFGIRATTVQVIEDNSEEIIPNQTFFTQNVSTLTGSNDLVALSIIVGASYQCSPPNVIDVLLQVAQNHSCVLKSPKPQAFALGFGDSSIDFELKFWINDPLIFKVVTSQLVCDIWQAFADNHIEIPYPQRDLHVRSTHQDLTM
ncbi:MAG: mechanosensitive ion channel domain-containing protein [Cyanobacteria bacterium P01_A01_bin.37]